ncbi:MAG: acetate--CoA ligase family protein, partial [Planctomycetes bacterium]|nr:acetate--CoA ligase family protein [Planctomycetota bacterium]
AEKFRVNKKKARDAVEQALSRGRNMLKGTELETLFTSYGIPMVPSRIVLTLDEALKFAKKVGYPVVAKIESAKAVHKSDFGGVRLDLRTPEDLKAAYGDLKKRFHKIDKNMKVMVQAMRSGGIETFFGAAPDPQYGRLQAFGLGGIHVEVFKDVVFRLHPLSRLNAEVMVDGIRAKALLEGARGKPPVDREQLIEISLRLSQMLTDLPEIVELDLNPFLAAWDASESCVLDCRVRLEKPATK